MGGQIYNPSALPPGNGPWLRNRSGRFEDENNFLFLPVFEPLGLGCTASSAVTDRARCHATCRYVYTKKSCNYWIPGKKGQNLHSVRHRVQTDSGIRPSSFVTGIRCTVQW